MTDIKDYHAHIYFNRDTEDKAKVIMDKIGREFAVEVGTFHKKQVGPHPCWSFQIKFDEKKFGTIVPWLMNNRNGLPIFIHVCSGNNFLDHTEHVCWLGKSQELDLSIFN